MGWKWRGRCRGPVPDNSRHVKAALDQGAQESLAFSANERLVERHQHGGSAFGVVEALLERLGSLREGEQILRGFAQAHDVLVFEHQPHQLVRPGDGNARRVTVADLMRQAIEEHLVSPTLLPTLGKRRGYP